MVSLRSPRAARVLCLALVAALLVTPLAAAPAAAHAVLQQTTPERGATLDAGPRQVVLRFDEPVESAFGAVRVFGADGERVEEGEAFHPGGDQDSVAVRLRDGLPDGGYTVTYRVISADSHPVQGGYVFSVGEGAAVGATVDELLAGQDAGPVTSVAFAVARGLQFAAITVALGVLAVLALVWPFALRALGNREGGWDAASDGFTARARRLLLVAAAVGAVSAVAGLVLQAATAAGTSAWAAVGDVGEVLGTRFGLVWGAGALVWLAVLALAARRMRAAGARRLAALAVPLLALALLPGLGGHAGVQSPVALLLPANVAHVLAAGAWIGGIAVLVLALPAATRRLEPPDRTRLLAATLARFSGVALVAVGVLLAAGITQASSGIDEPGELVSTAYGRAVLVKLALVAVLLALGAVNRRRLVPGLRRAAAEAAAPGAAGRLLRRSLRAEVALGVVVLGATGALAGSPPPTAIAAGPFSDSAVMGPARVELTAEPAAPGPNEIHLYLFRRSDGRQYDAPKELRFEASLPERDIERQRIEATKAGPGHYVANGAVLSPSGEWRLEVVARISEFDELRTTFDIPIE